MQTSITVDSIVVAAINSSYKGEMTASKYPQPNAQLSTLYFLFYQR